MPGDSSQWERIKDIFQDALEAPQAVRADRVRELCGGDEELAREVFWLLDQHAQAGTFLETPITRLAEPPPLEAGQVLAGRFRIERLVARGGMGNVYEATNLELSERVALKTVRAEIAGDATALVRFRHEIQLARRITHPNVCRVFDIERHQDDQRAVLFFTMELLKGETLAGRLERGSLSADETRDLGLQLASGLSAAHEAGVLHRDLKPSNVALVPGAGGTRAVLMDFGISRSTLDAERALPGLTRTGDLVGTPAYMAPEVLSGQPATPASDIFSLGTILLEMLMGARPSSLAMSGATLSRHLKPFDHRLRSVIRRCLAPEPATRYATAEEVAYALRGGSPRRRPVSSRRAALAATLFLAAVALFGFWFRQWNLRPSVAPGATVILTPVINSTNDGTFDGVTEAVRANVAQSAHFNLWDAARLPAVLLQMRRPIDTSLDAAAWREVALREGVPLVVFSALNRLGDSYLLNLRLERVGQSPGSVLGSWEHTARAGSREGLFDVVREAGSWIRRQTGETAIDISAADRPPQEITTSSWEALRLYADAERRSASNQADAAVRLLQQATALDPQFATGFMRLGDILTAIRRQEEGLAAWKTALDLARQQHLALREQLRIQGLYSMEVGDFRAAEAPLMVLTEKYPHDPLGYTYLASTLLYLGRAGESLAAAERGLRAGPGHIGLLYAVAHAHTLLNRPRELAQDAELIRARGRPQNADRFAGVALLLEGNTTGAEAAFRRMYENRAGLSPSEVSRASSILAAYYADQGRLNEAIATLEEGIAHDRDAGLREFQAEKLVGLAYLTGEIQDRVKARLAALDAAAISDNGDLRMKAVTVLARAGFVIDAERIANALASGPAGPRFNCYRYRARGEVLAARGRYAEAVAAMESATKADAPIAPQDYLARVLALAGDPARAYALYRKVVETPALVWHYPESVLPGLRHAAARSLRALGETSELKQVK